MTANHRVTSFELAGVTIAQLREGMESGRWTALSITEAYLQRIDEIDKRGPAVNALIEVNPDARAMAESLDEERRAGGVRGPLHGIPVALKDNIDTADRMSTTAGSLALSGNIAARDSFAAERLRRSGAVIIAKANLSEWANFRSNRSTSGWSARGGLTRNPYALDRNACGSSSGSAVAVSADLCAAAIGTETDGSIMCPANVNGIVGIKPTVGLVSRAGIIPIAHSQDTAGPMARTVADAAIVLGALTGIDPRDPATQDSGDRGLSDYTRFLDRDGLRGARLGLARGFCGFHRQVDDVVQAAVADLRRLGATVVDAADIATTKQLGQPEHQVLLYEFKADLNSYLSALDSSAPCHSLSEVIDFNEEHADREMPYFGQEMLIKAQEMGPLSDEEYAGALSECQRLARDEGIDATLAEHRLDAIIAPTGGPAWVTDLVNGVGGLGGSSTPAAVAGYPSITVPAGSVYGLPVGISFIGGAWSEPRLIQLAYAFEQATQHRRPPGFAATADLAISP